MRCTHDNEIIQLWLRFEWFRARSSFVIAIFSSRTISIISVSIQALWLSGYSDRLEIYFLREQEFESLRRR
jgi:hypothetical protein